MTALWTTRDLPTAAFLVLAGHTCQEVVPSLEHRDHALFKFQDSAELRADLQTHLSGDSKVSPAGYEYVRRELLAKARDVLNSST